MASRSQDLMPEMDMEPPTTLPPPALYIGIAAPAGGPALAAGAPRKYWPWCDDGTNWWCWWSGNPPVQGGAFMLIPRPMPPPPPPPLLMQPW
uniref:Uncharacterized protein n=1 Tax=Zea mays TaxID=4577 RepID=B8A2H5_MAIZE|nr:unknown [Zea mays]